MLHLNGKIVEDSEEMAHSEETDKQIREITNIYERKNNFLMWLLQTNKLNTELVTSHEMERIELETQLREKISALESQRLETAKNLSEQWIVSVSLFHSTPKCFR